MKPGDRLTLRIERPAAGGRMIARHEGAVVLVAACIPGEVVEAEVERIQRGALWATTRCVIDPSPDRIAVDDDWACGGSVFAHVGYDRQLSLKADIIRDGFARIGKMAVPAELDVRRSPIDGYRMRARLHLRRGGIGFFREGTHQLCPPASTRQLLPAAVVAIEQLAPALDELALRSVADVDLAENVAASERVLHLILSPGAEPSRLGSLAPIDQVTGITVGGADGGRSLVVQGSPLVSGAEWPLVVASGAGSCMSRVTSPHWHAMPG